MIFQSCFQLVAEFLELFLIVAENVESERTLPAADGVVVFDHRIGEREILQLFAQTILDLRSIDRALMGVHEVNVEIGFVRIAVAWSRPSERRRLNFGILT